jgi:hypothetical protein
LENELTEVNPDAVPVIAKVHKRARADQFHGR